MMNCVALNNGNVVHHQENFGACFFRMSAEELQIISMEQSRF
jgi:hypothetical protein